MLEYLRGRVGDRKLRLFACACCRAIQGFIPAAPCRAAVEAALRFADGRATAEELAAARAAAMSDATRAGGRSAAAWAACESAHPSAARAAQAASEESLEQIRRESRTAAADEAAAQAGFLRDIVGDPFGKVWVGTVRRVAHRPTVREIAEGLYDGAPQEDMAVLADELERLGCLSRPVLDHCRSDGPHVRGCWVLDLILNADEPSGQPSGLASGVEAVRQALAAFLGDRKYRRALRRSIPTAISPGPVVRLKEWDDFVRANPGYAYLADEELSAVFAVCSVHWCELERRDVPVWPDERDRHPDFLRARATQFPYSFPVGEAPGSAPVRPIWWCPECQRARADRGGSSSARSVGQGVSDAE